MFGLSTLEPGQQRRRDVPGFALLGLGLAPVMVGATEVIVGNAPIELAGVAGGLQQAAMQVGGSLGTAVLGAVMASRVDSVFPRTGRTRDSRQQNDAQLARRAGGQSGTARSPRAPRSRSPRRSEGVVHESFISGMALAFTCAGIVAVLAAGVAFFTKRGANDVGPSVHV